MASVAPRIGNNVSNATRINHKCHFSWQVQHLVMVYNMVRFSYKFGYKLSYNCLSQVITGLTVMLVVSGYGPSYNWFHNCFQGL